MNLFQICSLFRHFPKKIWSPYLYYFQNTRKNEEYLETSRTHHQAGPNNKSSGYLRKESMEIPRQTFWFTWPDGIGGDAPHHPRP